MVRSREEKGEGRREKGGVEMKLSLHLTTHERE